MKKLIFDQEIVGEFEIQYVIFMFGNVQINVGVKHKILSILLIFAYKLLRPYLKSFIGVMKKRIIYFLGKYFSFPKGR